ncbi:hypothetical protein [Streptomyces sp. NBRC 110035]|uniref:hypothetical protein n=1 Tax=Streptomyces sp. NBRC 110035 TaxID=1547867 RepID=UPI0005A78D0D|nr:hypothetical protein [Streptomyces sp. NBRC 110035]
MATTAMNLHVMAAYANLHGIHTGDQFATGDRLDICAIAYVVAKDCPAPPVFYTDECASLDLIEASEPAMDAIRAISASLHSEPCETNGQPDYIEHVSNWAATRAPFSSAPPTPSEVIGRILRAALALDTDRPSAVA